jgi:co-chaperonin GroES (HSP10)
MKLQGKSVLILPDTIPEKTGTGILNPDTTKKSGTGIVIDCGRGCETPLKGKKVMYDIKSASIIRLEDVEHHFTTEDKIYHYYE